MTPAESYMRPTWTQLEEQAYRRTAEAHRGELELLEELRRHLIGAVIQLQDKENDTAVQQLVYLVALGGTNYLHLAADLALKGYCTQSLSLNRNAFEFWLAGDYVLSKPEEAPRLLDASTRWPSPKQLRSALRSTRRATRTTKTEKDAIYDFLSQFTHATYTSVSGLFETEGADAPRLGPFYHRTGLIHSLSNTYNTILLFCGLLLAAFPELARSGWQSEGQELLIRVKRWTDEVVSEAGG